MRITICTFGSRGDTQPYVALALGLQQAGHQVTLVASASHGVAEWIRSYGIEVYPLRFSLQAFEDIFFEKMSDVEIHIVMHPPRIIGAGIKP